MAMIVAYKGQPLLELRLREALARTRAAATAIAGDGSGDALAELAEVEASIESALAIFADRRERIAFVDEVPHERSDPDSRAY